MKQAANYRLLESRILISSKYTYFLTIDFSTAKITKLFPMSKKYKILLLEFYNAALYKLS